MKKNSQTVINEDLTYICNNLQEEFAALSGKKLLITGGGGFLGYYLIQAVLHWNKTVNDDQRAQITIYDNYIRGVPTWLINLAKDKNLTLVKHDITHPLPPDIDDFRQLLDEHRTGFHAGRATGARPQRVGGHRRFGVDDRLFAGRTRVHQTAQVDDQVSRRQGLAGAAGRA